MGQYTLTSKFFSADININIVTGDSGGSENSIVVYESPGNDGGIAINLGRLNKNRVLTGKIISVLRHNNPGYTTSDVLQELSNYIATLNEVKDRGYPIVLRAPITDNTTGSYLIKSFEWNIIEGTPSFIHFSMTLTENRQINIKSNITNIIGGDVLRSMITRQQQTTI